MNFFWGQKEYDQWVTENGYADDKNIYCLNIEEAIQSGKEVFSVYNEDLINV